MKKVCKVSTGSYATVWAENDTAYNLWDPSWRTNWAHTVLREGLLLNAGIGVPLNGLCVKNGSLVGVAMPLAMATIDYASRNISHDRLLQWFRHVLQQLADMHSRGLVHADVKSRNVLVFPDNACLCDFGLSTAAALDTSHYSSAFTINYRPPELLKSPGPIETSGDVWALGITMYECLFGLPALGLEWPKDVLSEIRDKIPADAEVRLDVLRKRYFEKYEQQHQIIDIMSQALSYESRPTAKALYEQILPIVFTQFKVSRPFALPKYMAFTTVTEAEYSHNELPASNTQTLRAVCANMCALVQLDAEVPIVSALALFQSTASVDMPLLVRAACASTMAVMLWRDSLKLEYASQLCRQTLPKFEAHLDTMMIIGILNPEWASPWLSAATSTT